MRLERYCGDNQVVVSLTIDFAQRQRHMRMSLHKFVGFQQLLVGFHQKIICSSESMQTLLFDEFDTDWQALYIMNNCCVTRDPVPVQPYILGGDI